MPPEEFPESIGLGHIHINKNGNVFWKPVLIPIYYARFKRFYNQYSTSTTTHPLPFPRPASVFTVLCLTQKWLQLYPGKPNWLPQRSDWVFKWSFGAYMQPWLNVVGHDTFVDVCDIFLGKAESDFPIVYTHVGYIMRYLISALHK